MKKVFAIFAVAAMLIAASACCNNKKAGNKGTETVPASELATPVPEETIQETAQESAGEPVIETTSAEPTK